MFNGHGVGEALRVRVVWQLLRDEQLNAQAAHARTFVVAVLGDALISAGHLLKQRSGPASPAVELRVSNGGGSRWER